MQGRDYAFAFIINMVIVVIAFVVSMILFSLRKPVVAVIAFAIILVFLKLVTINYFLKKARKDISLFVSEVLLLIVFVVIFFTFIYGIKPDDVNYMEVHDTPVDLTFADAFYFSTITITTLGYGDIAPNGFFRTFAITEVWLGVFLIGYFIAGVSRITYSKERKNTKSNELGTFK